MIFFHSTYFLTTSLSSLFLNELNSQHKAFGQYFSYLIIPEKEVIPEINCPEIKCLMINIK